LDRARIGKLAVVGGLALLVAVSWWPGFQAAASEQVDSGLNRSLVCFAAARAVNAVLSVLQGTEVAAHPLGFGVTLTIGQVLEPANRMIEQFSALMLLAPVSFAVQKTLLIVSSWWLFSLLLTGVACVWGIGYWRGSASEKLSRLLAVVLLLRLAIPVVALGSELTFRFFFASEYRSAQSVLQAASGNLESLGGLDADTRSLGEKLRSGITRPATAAKAGFSAVKGAVEQLVERLVHLLALFFLNTLLFPLLILWLLLRLASSLVKNSASRPAA
jgi:hypothetical protein